MIHYRLATKADLPDIEALNQIYNYGNPEWFILQEIEAARVHVAVKDKHVVGFGLYQILWGNNPFLALVKILPEYQRQDIGTNLVKAIEIDLKKQGHTQLLSSCEPDNQVSINFQQYLGFLPTGEVKMAHGPETFFIKEL